MEDAEADEIISRLVGRLKAAREGKGMSMNQLASLAGIDQVAVSRIEKGERSPTLRTVLKITQALGLKLSDLLGKDGL